MRRQRIKRCSFRKELAIGMKIEGEHSHLFPKAMRKSMTHKIALDHIKEFPCYYSKGLVPMERRISRGK